AVLLPCLAGTGVQSYVRSCRVHGRLHGQAQSGWTKAQPYEGITFSESYPRVSNVAKQNDSRTEGVMMLGAKRAVLSPSAIICIGERSGWTKAQPYKSHFSPPVICIGYY